MGEEKSVVAEAIEAYLAAHWDEMVADIDALVRCESCEDLSQAREGAPFGPGPREALDAALALAQGMGFATTDVDGYAGYAEFCGAGSAAAAGAGDAAADADVPHIGIIGHVDVVPAGPGWTFPPFEVTRKDGYLIGRGVIDDKGPVVVALHALKFWKDRGADFPYPVRFIFGAAEETGMADVAYYRERHADPAFLFTPDAGFPVCYGEKGCFGAQLRSPVFEGGDILAFEGGTAANAVPGTAHAVVRAGDGTLRIEAEGRSAHASTPESGVSAIGILAHHLLDAGVGTPPERAFLELLCRLHDASDGSLLGIAACDEHLGALTAVGGTAAVEGGRIVQSVDVRYPTSITARDIAARLSDQAALAGATCEVLANVRKQPFLMDEDSPVIRALLDAYNEATGEQARPFTMGGSTYAHLFPAAASFGPEMPGAQNPPWVGAMHGPDEGVSEEHLKQAFRIYALTIPKLMELDLRLLR